MLEEDRLYWSAADVNKDGKLSKEEFAAFQVPENHAHMHEALIKNIVRTRDLNNDGKVDFKEFIAHEGCIVT